MEETADYGDLQVQPRKT